MPRITFTMPKLKFEKRKFVQELQKEAEEIFKEGAELFAIKASQEVPVWTGMARGSFLGPVQRFSGVRGTAMTYLGLADAISSIDITSARIGRVGKNGKRAFKPGRRLPRLSSGEIKNKYAGAKRAMYIFTNVNGKFTFKFYSNVKHYNILENTHMSNSASSPWHSLEIGSRYFKEYVRREMPLRLPKLRDFVIKQTLTQQV